jgi:hypothetical protein
MGQQSFMHIVAGAVGHQDGDPVGGDTARRGIDQPVDRTSRFDFNFYGLLWWHGDKFPKFKRLRLTVF